VLIAPSATREKYECQIPTRPRDDGTSIEYRVDMKLDGHANFRLGKKAVQIGKLSAQ
jgi:hypothetical protein